MSWNLYQSDYKFLNIANLNTIRRVQRYAYLSDLFHIYTARTRFNDYIELIRANNAKNERMKIENRQLNSDISALTTKIAFMSTELENTNFALAKESKQSFIVKKEISSLLGIFTFNIDFIIFILFILFFLTRTIFNYSTLFLFYRGCRKREYDSSTWSLFPTIGDKTQRRKHAFEACNEQQLVSCDKEQGLFCLYSLSLLRPPIISLYIIYILSSSHSFFDCMAHIFLCIPLRSLIIFTFFPFFHTIFSCQEVSIIGERYRFLLVRRRHY